MNFIPIKIRNALAVICVMLAIGCTPQKKLVYFQGSSAAGSSAADSSGFELKIFPEDILLIQLYTVNPDALPGLTATFDRQIVDNRSSYEKGFIVDKNGNLDIPLIGSIPVAGLTMLEAKNEILKRFQQFIDEPVVVIKKLSFKITILGEVSKPGLYYIPNEKMTFAEALALAGDLTNYGDRTDIKIYRKTAGEQLKEIKVDLTTKDIFSSEIRYVQQDDLIYVKPIRRKALANINPALVVFTSIISTTAIIITLIIRVNNP